MAKFDDRTSMGGEKSALPTTRWTEILDSKTSNEIRARSIINALMSKYWKPVYCYLRRKGYDNETTKDLTQGFFCEVVLGRELIQRADRSKGRFRTFLLTALDRYVIDVHDRETASKRKSKGRTFQLDDLDLPEVPTGTFDVTPEQGFHCAWVSELLDQVLSEVKQECTNIGKEIHWKVFCDRLLDPIMNSIAPSSLTEICRKYGIESEAKASNMIITVKRRLRRALERYMQQLVHIDSEVEQEIHELLKIFAKNSAG